jgi:hypothetical protein
MFYLTNVNLFGFVTFFLCIISDHFWNFLDCWNVSLLRDELRGPDNWRFVFVGSDTGMPQGDSLSASLGQLGECLALANCGACPLQPTFWW